MFIWKLIETVYNALVVMAYISIGLWAIALITNIVRSAKSRKYRGRSKYRKKYKKGENVDKYES